MGTLLKEASENSSVFYFPVEETIMNDREWEDIAEELINKSTNVNCQTLRNIDKTASKRVFIVHGREETSKGELKEFLININLEPVILHEQLNNGMTIIEKIEKYSDVSYGIVIYTGCDSVALNNTNDYKKRARQNVVFEHGYLLAKLGRGNVAALVFDDIELPNDISGVIYISKDHWKIKLAKELKSVFKNLDLNNLID